jgi:hypothetical protein
MVDVVLDLQLEEWLEIERELAARRLATVESTCAAIRQTVAAGDAAHARGDDAVADAAWHAARVLLPTTRFLGSGIA